MSEAPVVVHLSRRAQDLPDHQELEFDAGTDEDRTFRDESHETREKVL